jgi:hypothetical protein
MTFAGTGLDTPTLRGALLLVVVVSTLLLLLVGHLMGVGEVAAVALNPQPEPPGVV